MNVKLGDKVHVVRSKTELTADYYDAWKAVNVHPLVPVKAANATPAIRQLREYFDQNQDPEDDETRQRIRDALHLEGFAAWLVRTALKRNFDKARKDEEKAKETST
ncbi:uncharacterized protein KY384_002367 [Bacidia gigantensis]|uniref:uncharacterized protein n=1 Tax=Bacidia gigantensis TaxID=2732470 RepID=UPI001D0557EF|nr:uncharacterized protein KY384_002367 [Bacidia gigantensis]KAG8532490.1 hypothetical protein KY384_002367 [Bacidia gigantensis]